MLLLFSDFYKGVKDPDRLYSVSCCEGLSIDVLHSLASELGFEYQLYIVPDGKFGAFDATLDRWTGMVKELLDGQQNYFNTPLNKMQFISQ